MMVRAPSQRLLPRQQNQVMLRAMLLSLFDGKDLSKWKSGKDEAKWVVKEGYFECVPKSGYLMTKDGFGPDVQLHIEWAAPNPPEGTDQGRGQ
jgi:hypothetical protein